MKLKVQISKLYAYFESCLYHTRLNFFRSMSQSQLFFMILHYLGDLALKFHTIYVLHYKNIYCSFLCSNKSNIHPIILLFWQFLSLTNTSPSFDCKTHSGVVSAKSDRKTLPTKRLSLNDEDRSQRKMFSRAVKSYEKVKNRKSKNFDCIKPENSWYIDTVQMHTDLYTLPYLALKRR